MEKRRGPICPICHSTLVLRIVYGYPGPKLIEGYERGEVLLGGCCVSVGSPQPAKTVAVNGVTLMMR